VHVGVRWRLMRQQMKRFAIIIGVFAVTLPRSVGAHLPSREASGDDFLLPESGILFEPGPSYQYQELFRQLFLEQRPGNRECQMIVGSGFGGREHEEAVLIERDRQGHSPIAVRLSTTVDLAAAIMNAIAERARGGNWEAVLGSLRATISEVRAPLKDATADTLSQVCEMMLGTVRYSQGVRHPMDGGEVHFAHFDPDHGYRAGKATAEKGRVAAYVRVLEQLGRVAAASPADRAIEEKRVRELATALIGDLANAGQPLPDIQRERKSGSAVLPLPPGIRRPSSARDGSGRQ